eukprot:Hpha_TRINITY_DN10019_c0_g1::TRINITY_DN10019_c0_g1_i1::g.83876::m.83876
MAPRPLFLTNDVQAHRLIKLEAEGNAEWLAEHLWKDAIPKTRKAHVARLVAQAKLKAKAAAKVAARASAKAKARTDSADEDAADPAEDTVGCFILDSNLPEEEQAELFDAWQQHKGGGKVWLSGWLTSGEGRARNLLEEWEADGREWIQQLTNAAAPP